MRKANGWSGSALVAGIGALVWAVAAFVCFVPFAANTSALNAVMLNVPGEQGNWWHLLIGFPFFLAFPAIWVHVRALAGKTLNRGERWTFWGATLLAILGTLSIEVPFLMLRAGTSSHQRAEVIGLGLGTIVLGGLLLFVRRRAVSLTEACLAGLETAYLANAAVCIVVYSSAKKAPPQVGWYVTSVLVWVFVLELAWIYVRSYANEERGAALAVSD